MRRKLLVLAGVPVALVVCAASVLAFVWGPGHAQRVTGYAYDGVPVRCTDCHQAFEAPSPTAVRCAACHHALGVDEKIAWANASDGPRYLSPVALAISADGRRLYVACHESDLVMAVDTASGQVVGQIAVDRMPFGLALSPDGDTLYVSERRADTVAMIDTATLTVRGRIAVGRGPCGLATDRDGKVLFVANTSSDDISVVDLVTGTESKRLVAGRGPFAVTASPDGSTVVVANRITLPVPARSPPVSEVTIIDARRQIVVDRRRLRSAHLLEGAAFTPDGRAVVVSLVRSRNLVPATQLGRGWMMSSGVALIDLAEGGGEVQLLTDELHAAFSDPSGVVVSPDGERAYVAAGGGDRLITLDLARARKILADTPADDLDTLADNFGVAAELVVERVPTGANPRGVVISPDGARVFVANRLDDSITVFEAGAATRPATRTISLGGPSSVSRIRRGERVFHDGRVTFQGQFSCRSCHPEGHSDGLAYDLEPDGLGLNILDNRSLLGLHGTAPFKWNGKNKSLQDQCGLRFATFLSRADPIAGDELDALVAYIESLAPPPNWRGQGGAALEAAVARGRAIFMRTTTNKGQPIAVDNQCATCHPPPLFTHRKPTDVETKGATDTVAIFDTPHLRDIGRSAPYLHDGRAETLESIWTVHSPNDEHGVTSDLSKEELNDLVEYMKSI